MKTLKFSYNGDTVGVKVPDKADMATAVNRAFTSLDLEYSELWDVLDEDDNAVELTTKVKLFREGKKFVLKAPPPEEKDLAASEAFDAAMAAHDEPKPSTKVLVPSLAPTVPQAARIVAGPREFVAVVPVPVPAPVTAPMPAEPAVAQDETGKVVAEMPPEIATVPSRTTVLASKGQWPIHGQMRTGGLPGEIKKVG